MPKPSGNRVNATEKHCSYCKKAGHLRENCWSLNGRKSDKGYAARGKKSRSDGSVTSGSDEEENKRKKKTVSVAELQVIEINTQAELNLAIVPIREAKGGRIRMLYDTEATVSLIKQKYLKGETPAEKTRLKLTGITGHKACVIGKIKATIQLRNKEIKHTVYVVKK